MDDDFISSVKGDFVIVNINNPVLVCIVHQNLVLGLERNSVNFNEDVEFLIEFGISGLDVDININDILVNGGCEVEIELGNSNFDIVGNFNSV